MENDNELTIFEKQNKKTAEQCARECGKEQKKYYYVNKNDQGHYMFSEFPSNFKPINNDIDDLYALYDSAYNITVEMYDYKNDVFVPFKENEDDSKTEKLTHYGVPVTMTGRYSPFVDELKSKNIDYTVLPCLLYHAYVITYTECGDIKYTAIYTMSEREEPYRETLFTTSTMPLDLNWDSLIIDCIGQHFGDDPAKIKTRLKTAIDKLTAEFDKDEGTEKEAYYPYMLRDLENTYLFDFNNLASYDIHDVEKDILDALIFEKKKKTKEEQEEKMERANYMVVRYKLSDRHKQSDGTVIIAQYSDVYETKKYNEAIERFNLCKNEITPYNNLGATMITYDGETETKQINYTSEDVDN